MNNKPLAPWLQKKLGDKALTEIKYGKPNPKKEGSIPVIGSSGVFDHTEAPLVEAPTILVGRKGNAGSIQLISEPCWPSDTTFYLKLLTDEIDYDFLSEYLTYQNISNQKTQTTLPSLTIEDLKHVKIAIPPLVEQCGIVKVLGAVDECIRLMDGVIERTEELKRGLMQRLLTRGIWHTEYKHTLLGEIPKTWSVERLGRMFKLSSGEQRPREISDEKSELSQYPVYGGNGILGYSNQINVKTRAIVIGRVGAYCGSVHLTKNKSWITDNALYIKQVLKEHNIEYMAYLLHYKKLNRYSKRSGQPLITQKTVYDIQVALPSCNEQNEIAAILRLSDNQIMNEKKQKDRIEKLKHGLMQVLLSGNIRVELRKDGLHRIRDSREAHH